MQTIVSSVLLATTVGGLAQPAPIDWTRTPTGPENAVLYKIEQAGDSLWSVGINLEPGPQVTVKFYPLPMTSGAVGMKSHQELWRQPMALHFDGKTWTEFGTPEITGQFHDLEFVDGKAIAVGGIPHVDEPLITELVGQEFVRTTTPPGAGYVHGSVQTGRCLWTVGVAAERANGFEMPFIAIGKHRPDFGHGLPRPGC